MNNIKSLRTHLFEQLDRLAGADESNIDTEVKKTVSMIQISEQILTTAQTEIDMRKSVQEIDTTIDFIADEKEEQKQIEQKTFTIAKGELTEPEELFNAETDDDGFYEGTSIAKKSIPIDNNGNYLTEEKRLKKFR